MGQFNKRSKDESKTTNHEGAPAYKLSAFDELYSLVVTTNLSNNFYESSDDRLLRLRKLIKSVSPDLVLKLAIYARKSMYLRSIPLVLLVEFLKVWSNTELVKAAILKIIQRADEITEILAYYQLANGRVGTKKLNKLSNSLKKGIAAAFNNFDEYQFAKYNRQTEIKLRDALFLTHPIPKDWVTSYCKREVAGSNPAPGEGLAGVAQRLER